MSTPDEWVIAASCKRGLEEAPHELVLTDERFTLLFDGVLYERRNLEHELGFPTQTGHSDAEVVLAAYRRWGDGAPARLNGTFTIVAWDSAKSTLQAVRDPLGLQPLFRSERGEAVLFSNSLGALVRDPRVPGHVSPVALAALIARRMPFQEETFYAGVERVPQGHVWRQDSNGSRLQGYWNPRREELGANVKEVDPEDLDAVLEQTVARRLSGGPIGIYLSGGLDSIAVAAYAAELERYDGRTPLALSLVIPGEEIVDGEKQRAVAESLELPQVLLPLEPPRGEGILEAALTLTDEWPAPLLDPWLPGFLRLNREAVDRGYRMILTGNGGDEWQTSPYLAADLIRTGRLRQLANLSRSFSRSDGHSSRGTTATFLWRFGLRPLLIELTQSRLERYAYSLLRLRLSHILPPWLAPDRVLRRELLDRPTARTSAGTSFASRASNKLYDHPLQDASMEELYEASRRSGVRLVHPFCDLDLLALRYRTRPTDLNRGGRPKGIVREALEHRFPERDLTGEASAAGGNLFVDLIGREAPQLLERLGGMTALADLGVVDPVAFRRQVIDSGGKMGAQDATRIWDALSLEAWVKSHA